MTMDRAAVAIAATQGKEAAKDFILERSETSLNRFSFKQLLVADPVAFAVLRKIVTMAPHGAPVQISQQDMANEIGRTDRTIRSAVSRLQRDRLITVTRQWKNNAYAPSGQILASFRGSSLTGN